MARLHLSAFLYGVSLFKGASLSIFQAPFVLEGNNSLSWSLLGLSLQNLLVTGLTMYRPSVRVLLSFCRSIVSAFLCSLASSHSRLSMRFALWEAQAPIRLAFGPAVEIVVASSSGRSDTSPLDADLALNSLPEDTRDALGFSSNCRPLALL